MLSYCLPKERPQPYLTLVARGSSPDYFQTSDMGVIHASRLDNQTGREPQVGDFMLITHPRNQLITPEQFLERFDAVDPIEHLGTIQDMIDSVEYAHYGPLSSCCITLKNGVQILGHVNPPTGDFLTKEEAEQLTFIEASRNLALLESHRIAMRHATQESERD